MAENLYHVTDSGTGLTVTVGAYDPKITAAINARIRNLPIVKKYINDMAELTRGRAGEGFIVVEAGGKSRYRAYVAPDTSDAIKAELKDGALLKAALSMRGK
jgi:hypothetical protein